MKKLLFILFLLVPFSWLSAQKETVKMPYRVLEVKLHGGNQNMEYCIIVLLDAGFFGNGNCGDWLGNVIAMLAMMKYGIRWLAVQGLSQVGNDDAAVASCC